MAVSARVRQMMEGSSWVRRMFDAGIELTARHGPGRVCDFSIGNPNLEPPPAFREVLRDLAADTTPHRHGYMPNAGYPEVRDRVAEWISREQGVTVTRDNVIMTCGAGGALNVALKTILDPGDVVIVPRPCFTEYRFYVENHGASLRLVESTPDFDLDLEAIRRALTPATGALLINSPNNPTGRIYPEKTLRDLGLLLERESRRLGRIIYLVSDEPYRRIVYDGARVPSVFAAYPHTLIASSYSKDLSLPGERIGWLAIHPGADQARDLAAGASMCNRVLGFVNAPALMQRAVARLTDVSVDIEPYRRKRDRLVDALAAMGYHVPRPQGTFYLFPRAPGGDDLAFVQRLQEELVLAVPGRGFGLEGWFRLAFCVDDVVIERSLAGFRKAIEG